MLRLTTLSASSAPRNISVFTEMPVADERQTAHASHESMRPAPEYRIVQCEPNHARRAEAEAFVRERFLRSHGAQIASFMPKLVLLSDSAGRLGAVAGFRRAAEETLFLERYLPSPIEQLLGSRAGARVRRADIVEVGNFAALDSRRAKILMSFMPAFFLQRSARWIVFTATTAIRTILCAMGGRCVEVGAADGALAGSADEWGSYYQNDPRVMAGFLPAARRIKLLWRTPHGN
jgi:hypothetical protein